MCFQYGLQSKRIFTKAILAISLLSLSAYSQDTLNITDLEKDANGNYLTPDAPIVQSLPEYNKDMKAGDLFKYSGNNYYKLYETYTLENLDKCKIDCNSDTEINESLLKHGNLYTIWGELLDASEYNYIQPYRHGYCQYDKSVWEPVRNHNDWTYLPPCIKAFFISSNRFYELTKLPIQPYRRLSGEKISFAIDPQLAVDGILIGLLKDIQYATKTNIQIDITNEFNNSNNIYLVDVNLEELRKKIYPKVYERFLKDPSLLYNVYDNEPYNLKAFMNLYSYLSSHIHFYPQNINKDNGVIYSYSFQAPLNKTNNKNWVTDETFLWQVFMTNNLQQKTFIYDNIFYNLVNYIPFTSPKYWDVYFYPKHFNYYSEMLLVTFNLMGVGVKSEIDYNSKDRWNEGAWLSGLETNYAITLTDEGKFLVPDFILEGLKYIKPLDKEAMDRLYYGIEP